MNLEDVSKREVLDFKQFRSRVMDDTFKYLAPDVQDPLSGDKTGLHTIKREPAYDWVGYANAIWSPDQAGITIPRKWSRWKQRLHYCSWSNLCPNA
jgi:hypothetical protein